VKTHAAELVIVFVALVVSGLHPADQTTLQDAQIRALNSRPARPI